MNRWTLFICCFYSVNSIAIINGQTLTVTSLPDILFMSNSGSHDIVEGSVIQLFCSVESTTATFTWMLNANQVVIDVPHLRIRTYNDSTSITTVLTVDNFGIGDSGTYQCTAHDGEVSGSGNITRLSAVSSFPDGTIVIRQQPVDNEVTFEGSNTPLGRNRTTVSVGDTIDPKSTPDEDKLLRCVAGHQGNDTTNHIISSVVWIKDGEVVVDSEDITIRVASETNGVLSSTLQITNFQQSNAGVYQCIFSDGDGEVITTTPLRLDTGDVLKIQGVSPQTIVIQPPEKLVIEVKTSGHYRRINWAKNSVLFSPNPTSSFFVKISDEFPNYNEIFVREPTTENDIGVYEVNVSPSDPITQTVPSTVQFAVISAVNANTTSVSGYAVVVVEGESITISCISTGIPVPAITWEFNNVTSSFNHTDTVVDYRLYTTPTSVDVEPGSITSNLHILNATYPEHDGVYTCIGVNSEAGTTSSAFITVDVQGPPEQPLSLVVSVINSYTTVVSWKEPFSHVPITNYTLRVTEIESGVFSDVLILPNNVTVSVKVSNLQAGKRYQTSVRADNSIGAGDTTFSAVFSTPPEAILFQLHLLNIQNCKEWVAIDNSSKLSEVASAIATNVEQQCQCGFTRASITLDEFQCFPESQKSVTYRGEIHETTQTSSVQLVSYIENWIAGSVVISIQGLLITVDNSCDVTVTTFDDEGCNPVTASTQITTNDAMTITHPNLPITYYAIAGGVVGVVIIICIPAMIVCAVCLALYQKKGRKQKKPHDQTGSPVSIESQPQVFSGICECVDIDLKNYTVDNSDDDDYDLPITTTIPAKQHHQHQQTSGDYEFTQCPAYQVATYINVSPPSPRLSNMH